MTRFIQRMIASAVLSISIVAAAVGPSYGQDKVVRIGFQKYGKLVLLKSKGTLEDKLKAAGYKVVWTEFPSGPPLLEALNVGAIDFGHAGEAPPIFGQAAGAPFLYVAHEPPAPEGEAILVPRESPIKTVADLRGKKVGLPEYQLTANVWARSILEDDYGVKPSDIHWIRAGIEDAGRPEKISIKLPSNVKLEDGPPGKSSSQLLAEGAIDGFIAPRPPSLPKTTPNVGWLFPDPTAAAKDYFKRTGIFPIMHLVGVRKTLAEQHPWLPGAVYKAFQDAKTNALELLSDTSATKVTLPFVEERLKEARELMGEDFWSYGLKTNRKTLETFLRHHHAQGLSSREVKPEELFHPGTHEAFSL